MALTVPNLDRIQKLDPNLGEALQKIQKYTNANVTQVTGNRVPPPPVNAAVPKG